MFLTLECSFRKFSTPLCLAVLYLAKNRLFIVTQQGFSIPRKNEVEELQTGNPSFLNQVIYTLNFCFLEKSFLNCGSFLNRSQINLNLSVIHNCDNCEIKINFQRQTKVRLNINAAPWSSKTGLLIVNTYRFSFHIIILQGLH